MIIQSGPLLFLTKKHCFQITNKVYMFSDKLQKKAVWAQQLSMLGPQ